MMNCKVVEPSAKANADPSAMCVTHDFCLKRHIMVTITMGIVPRHSFEDSPFPYQCIAPILNRAAHFDPKIGSVEIGA